MSTYIYLLQQKSLTFDRLAKYKEIHLAISGASRSLQPYVAYLAMFLIFGASIGIISHVLTAIELFHKASNGPLFVAANVFTTTLFIAQTVLIFLLPLRKMSHTSKLQKKIVKILYQNIESNDDEQNQRLASYIEGMQRIDGAGFRLFGRPVTTWRTFLWVILGPLLKIFVTKVAQRW